MSLDALGTDVPLLCNIRDAYRQMLATLNEMKREEKDVRMLIAICSILDETQANLDRVLRRLVKLQRPRAVGGVR